jgi:hypothetical protein
LTPTLRSGPGQIQALPAVICPWTKRSSPTHRRRRRCQKRSAFIADSQIPRGVCALEEAVTEPAWRKKPGTWLRPTTDDPPPAQHFMSRRAGTTMVESKGSHTVYVPKPSSPRSSRAPRLPDTVNAARWLKPAAKELSDLSRGHLGPSRGTAADSSSAFSRL